MYNFKSNNLNRYSLKLKYYFNESINLIYKTFYDDFYKHVYIVLKYYKITNLYIYIYFY